ncbi:MAG: glycosyltransferase family 2 protein [bacterium]|nr:glycosyltransferase family 2 protein [bacterium]
MPNDTKVTALIITYAPSPDVLGACIDSLRNQNPKPEILIADNRAPSDPEHKVALSFKETELDGSGGVKVLKLDRNFGFGGAINLALNYIKTPYVLISNFDIVYDPGYIESALSRLESSRDDVIGIAGKTLFYPPDADKDWPGRGPGDAKPERGKGTGGVIDNTGTLVNGLILAYNRGVGQIDIGQFDESDRPMGACFAAFLVRRSAFNPIKTSGGGVGLLDRAFFMYYEDIDWCYRANLLGFKILYEPKAVAWHHHSLTTRNKGVFFKYHLIQRNLYRTIMKNMRFRTVIRLWWMHARLHVRRARIERDFGAVTAKILFETLLWAIPGMFMRGPIQSHRKISDTDIINLSIGEEGHLDDIALRPKLDWSNPLTSFKRLQRLYPSDPAIELIPMIEGIIAEKNEGLERKVLETAEIVCPSIVPIMKQITGL